MGSVRTVPIVIVWGGGDFAFMMMGYNRRKSGCGGDCPWRWRAKLYIEKEML